MTIAIFVIGLFAGAALLGLSTLGLLLDGFQFWPPPQKGSWQDILFWILFRVMFVSLVLVCFIDYGSLGQIEAWRSIAGWLVAGAGFGLAFRITAQLGWRDAHGDANELTRDGWFAWSRNPIYVLSILGMAGIALAVNSLFVNILLLIWAVMYVVAPFAEEPWLLEKFGTSYSDYMAEVPRFIGWPPSGR